MKAPFAKVILVNGIERHFTGDTITHNLDTFIDEKRAKEYGHKWVTEKNAEYKERGANWRAFYELKTLNLWY